MLRHEQPDAAMASSSQLGARGLHGMAVVTPPQKSKNASWNGGEPLQMRGALFRKTTFCGGILTGAVTVLFHPRQDSWTAHFEWKGIHLAGRTAIGRTTVQVLDLNSDDRLDLRLASGE